MMREKLTLTFLAGGVGLNLWALISGDVVDAPWWISLSLVLVNLILVSGVSTNAKWVAPLGVAVYLAVTSEQAYFAWDQWHFGLSGAALVQTFSCLGALTLVALFVARWAHGRT